MEQRPGFGILEIKSLHSKQDQPLTDLKCLDEYDQLLKRNPWYTQIQVTAFVTNASYAILFLYNGIDRKIVEVPLDSTWVWEQVKTLERHYFELLFGTLF